MKLEEFLQRTDAIELVMRELEAKGDAELSDEMVTALMQLSKEEIEDLIEV